MDNDKFRKPDFLIIGAQKSGTTWLWRMIDQHPQTALPQKKEIHYFGGSENYRQGKQWYYEHFADIDKSKITGEASTTYLFDFVPFWHNPSDDLLMDNSLPSLPELINNELPDVKIIAILRNPVRRAISAYNHLMRRVVMKKYTHDAGISPTFSITEVATLFPKKRILEYGFYAKYLKQWYDTISSDRIKVFIFEDDLLEHPEKMISDTYRFLDIDPNFIPTIPPKAINKSWGRTRTVFSYYLPDWVKRLTRNRGGNFLDRHDFLKKGYIKQRDFKFLNNAYKNEKNELEKLLGRKIPW